MSHNQLSGIHMNLKKNILTAIFVFSTAGCSTSLKHEVTLLSCTDELASCANRSSGCVSLGVPYQTATCDQECQAGVIKKMHDAGVSVFAHPNIPSPKAPLGCVGFRPDLGGTEEGARCISNVLGYEYHADGCNEDGWPYIVRVH